LGGESKGQVSQPCCQNPYIILFTYDARNPFANFQIFSYEQGTFSIQFARIIDGVTLSLGFRRTIINCFWHGSSLSWIEIACLKSFVTHGFRVRLYSYQTLVGIPSGVELVDANSVVPEIEMFFYDGPNTTKSKGTPATFSDYFRYKVQEHGLGLWVDCDVYCLQPFEFASEDNIYVWENDYRISGAILKLNPNGAILSELLSLFEPPYNIPRWVAKDARKALIEKHGSTNIHPRFLPWGCVGPIALHALLTEKGTLEQALPRSSFFPVLVWDLDDLFDPEFDLDTKIDKNTFGIQLWNNEIRHRREAVPPKGSFLRKVWEEGQL